MTLQERDMTPQELLMSAKKTEEGCTINQMSMKTGGARELWSKPPELRGGRQNKWIRDQRAVVQGTACSHKPRRMHNNPTEVEEKWHKSTME